MLGKRTMALSEMKNSQTGTVKVIKGCGGMTSKLESIGIRLGCKIKKKSALLGFGPVIVLVGNTEIAIGHKMALKILVEVDRE